MEELYLKTENFSEAEKNFREDLDRHRENGWSLYGLMKALEGASKNGEALKFKERFNKAWAHADFKLE